MVSACWAPWHFLPSCIDSLRWAQWYPMSGGFLHPERTFPVSPQVWAYTYTQQIIQEELCLSVITLFPGAPVVLVLCKNGDARQVRAQQVPGARLPSIM